MKSIVCIRFGGYNINRNESGEQMTVKEIQGTKTIEQIIDDMALFDDDLMTMVFDGNIPQLRNFC